MNHVLDIKCLINTLVHSPRFHALVIESPAGWGKSSTLERTLNSLNLSYFSMGSYVTPLSLYNAIVEHPNDIILLDDSVGLVGDPVGMAILKAAAWSSAGSSGERVVTWKSSSNKVSKPSTIFHGKVIVLANNVPQGQDTNAFLSRALYLQIRFDASQAAEMLEDVSRQNEFFENQSAAEKVASFLSQRIRNADGSSINLRTLQMGYELAITNPDNWQMLLEKLLPRHTPTSVVERLLQSDLPVEEQSKEFMRVTGLSRRTFFNYRKQQV